MINGNTELIAHIGYPTHTFKSPMIYNPYFAEAGINAVASTPDDMARFIKTEGVRWGKVVKDSGIELN